MAKSKRLTAKEQRAQFLKDAPSMYRTLLNMYTKNPAGLSSATLKNLQLAQNELKGKRRLSESEYARFSDLYESVKTERYISGQKQWTYRKKASEKKLERKIAQRILTDDMQSLLSYSDRKKERESELSKYEPEFAEGIKKQISKIKDIDYRVKYREYDVTKKEEMLRRYLGIGSNGVTLSDESVFTQDEFNAILDRYDIPLDKFIEDEDIRKERYTQVKYQDWKENIDDLIEQLINKEDLTPREREGLKKMFKKFGV